MMEYDVIVFHSKYYLYPFISDIGTSVRMVISAAVQSADSVLLQLPLPTLVALIAVTTVVVAVAVRILSNTFHGNKPPVEEGIPFIGGLLKFSKVSGSTAGC